MELKTLEQIKVELDAKFSGTTYSANAVLNRIDGDDREREYPEGSTDWIIQYTAVEDQRRLNALDGLITRKANGVTTVVSFA